MKYTTKDLFPSLFQFGVVSVSYIFNGYRYQVEKKYECVDIYGSYAMSFLIDISQRLGCPLDDLSTYIEIDINKDGSISVYDKPFI
jgi:hypothetical protein